MSKQIEQLKADKAALEVALKLIAHQDMHTDDFLISRIKMFEAKIADLERNAPDTWENARNIVGYWEAFDNTNKAIHFDREIEVAKYVRHLERQINEGTCNAPNMDF